ncbi:MAG: hypothetical protein ABSF71_28175 [Terriglobia bacterium]
MREPMATSGPAVSTWELLRGLGFANDPTLASDVLPGLSFDFGNFRLRAISGTNRHFVNVVLLSGGMVTERSICEVECEIPPEVESVEQGMAWIAWCLDDAAGGRFEPLAAPQWLKEGRQYLHLLPRKRRMAAYAARPQCVVQRAGSRGTQGAGRAVDDRR